MLGRKERDQLEMYMCGSLRDLVLDDPVLVKVDRVLDLSWRKWLSFMRRASADPASTRK